MEFSCLLCPFSCTNEVSFSSHLIRWHKNDPSFVVKCSFCGAAYNHYNSYLKHMQRKHAVFAQIPAVNCVDNYDTGDVEPRNCDNVSLTQEVNNKIAGLVLKLKGKHNVSQTAVQTVVENVSDIIHVIQNHTRAAVQHHEVVNGCAPSTLVGFSDIIDGPLLDRKLQSQFMRDKYLVENLGMIQPQKVKLGESVRTHEQQVKTLSRYGYIVPFLPNLSKFLSCPEVMDELQHCNESTDGYMYDICDAEFIKDHPLYIEDQNFLKFMLNCDDFEVCNPVGSHTKVRKITVWYWLLLNIRPVYRSRLPVIQLLAMAKSSHIR